MKKFINYLNKNNINYKPVVFGWDYFENAAPIKRDGVTLEIENNNRATLEKIQNYCKRYNYIIIHDHIMPDLTRKITVITNQDNNDLNLYDEYRTTCKNECEQYAHKFYTGVITGVNLNNELLLIMDYYGKLYNKALATAAA